MVISKVAPAKSRPSTEADRGPSPLGAGSGDDALQQDISAFQRLIDQVTADGRLARWGEEAIRSALVSGQAYSSAKCALFRQLQERVWQAELYLDP